MPDAMRCAPFLGAASVARPRVCNTEDPIVPTEDLPSSVLGARLAFSDHPPPSWAELGLEPAKAAAFAWQQQRQYAEWHELVALQNTAGKGAWVKEAHALLGVVGELVLVAIEAEVEKEIVSIVLAEAPTGDERALASRRAVAQRSQRFFAEGQANQLVVAGHSVANLTLRLLAVHPNFDIAPLAKALGVDEERFTPGSAHRNAWTSLNPATARALRDSAEALGQPSLVAFAETVEALVLDQRWQHLASLRNNQYHRWRGESPGVAGVNFKSPSALNRLNRGQVVGLSRSLLSPYEEGDDVLTEIVDASREALLWLADWMPDALDLWAAALSDLLNPPADG